MVFGSRFVNLLRPEFGLLLSLFALMLLWGDFHICILDVWEYVLKLLARYFSSSVRRFRRPFFGVWELFFGSLGFCHLSGVVTPGILLVRSLLHFLPIWLLSDLLLFCSPLVERVSFCLSKKAIPHI